MTESERALAESRWRLARMFAHRMARYFRVDPDDALSESAEALCLWAMGDAPDNNLLLWKIRTAVWNFKRHLLQHGKWESTAPRPGVWRHPEPTPAVRCWDDAALLKARGLSSEQVAAALGISREAVNNRLWRIRKAEGVHA